jgi:hypothetical protein
MCILVNLPSPQRYRPHFERVPNPKGIFSEAVLFLLSQPVQKMSQSNTIVTTENQI